MPKYHDTGTKCNATKKACPLGLTDGEHIEARNEKEFQEKLAQKMERERLYEEWDKDPNLVDDELSNWDEVAYNRIKEIGETHGIYDGSNVETITKLTKQVMDSLRKDGAAEFKKEVRRSYAESATGETPKEFLREYLKEDDTFNERMDLHGIAFETNYFSF